MEGMGFIVALGALGLLAFAAQSAEASSSDGGGLSWNPQSDFAAAIATAEGANVVGSIPYRNFNPGDLVGWPGYPSDLNGYTIFPDSASGWNALEEQLNSIRSGTSKYYTTGMSIQQMAQIWSPVGWQNWANNVAQVLDAQTSDPIGDYL